MFQKFFSCAFRRTVSYLKDHIFTKRYQKFCFRWSEVSWHRGLCYIAIMTIAFGITQFIAFNAIAFRGAPSAIHSYVMFPIFSTLVFTELIFFIAVGVMLWVGLHHGNLKVIKSFPWYLLWGYFFAFFFIIEIIRDGEHIIQSLVWSHNGMLIKAEPKKENQSLQIQSIIFYTFITLLILALYLFTTYIIILTLSWIDKLENEIDDEIV